MRSYSACAATIIILALLSVSPAAKGQTEFVRSTYFPADLEFKELQEIKADVSFDKKAPLDEVTDGPILSEVGFQRYSRRSYSLVGGGNLAIEVVALQDPRAAYSLLTLLKRGEPQKGPPGDILSAEQNTIVFTKGRYWVRVQSSGGADLIRRVAVSVSNRIGGRAPFTPALVKHFPSGYQPASLQYFLGPKALQTLSHAPACKELDFSSELELAQARYSIENQTGVLSLISFPTSQLAEEYFNSVPGPGRTEGSPKVYAKRAGPLLGILEGSFDSTGADALLGAIQFKYSIKWIYDKNNRGSNTIWGVPVGILGTVVRSLAFTALLCCLSVLAGVGFAAFRFLLRGYAPHNPLDRPERTELIRLKIDEN